MNNLIKKQPPSIKNSIVKIAQIFIFAIPLSVHADVNEDRLSCEREATSCYDAASRTGAGAESCKKEFEICVTEAFDANDTGDGMTAHGTPPPSDYYEIFFNDLEVNTPTYNDTDATVNEEKAKQAAYKQIIREKCLEDAVTDYEICMANAPVNVIRYREENNCDRFDKIIAWAKLIPQAAAALEALYKEYATCTVKEDAMTLSNLQVGCSITKSESKKVCKKL